MMKELYSIFQQSTGVCTDTRKLKEGNVFFALKGPNFDGNKYAAQALENGACHAVIDDKKYLESLDGAKVALVDDVLTTLQQLANHHRHSCKAKIIGITGSNGKTTTKELMAKVLESQFSIIYTQGNLNNHIGVPLTLLSIQESTEMAIIEMGANHIGDIAELCQIAEPDFGLITNIGKAHLEGFGSQAGVKKGKGELFAHLKTKNGQLFVNRDVQHLGDLAGDYEHCSFYSLDHNFGEGIAISVDERDNQLHLSFQWAQKLESFSLNLYGSYNIPNVLAALNVGYHFGVSPIHGASALETYYPQNSRSQQLATEKNTIFLDAYNANPTSVENALKAFLNITAADKMVILGDMFELGGDAPELHSSIAEIACRDFKDVILIGHNFYHTEARALKLKSTEDALEYLQSKKLKDFTILLKGSRGMALERLLDVL